MYIGALILSTFRNGGYEAHPGMKRVPRTKRVLSLEGKV